MVCAGRSAGDSGTCDAHGLSATTDFVVNTAWERPSRTYNSKDLANAKVFRETPDDV